MIRISAAAAAVVAILAAAVLAGCSHTTTGSVAMTTEPGPALTTVSSRPTPTRSSTPSTSGPSSPGAQPPGDAMTMTCKEYSSLDEDSQQSVIDEILSQNGSVLGPENADLAKTLADATCSFLPDAVLSEILFGGQQPR
jgi:hypothetical protein